MNRQELETQLKEKISKVLPILKKNNNIDNVREAFFCSQSDETVVKIMTYSERELFNDPIKFILNKKRIVELYSEEFIGKKLVEYYHKLLLDESKIDEYVKELVEFLLNDGSKD